MVSPPLNRTVYENVGTEQLDCDADGNAPDQKQPTYSWYKDFALSGYKLSTGGKYPQIRIENNGKRLKFTAPPRSLATIYYCAASNQLGTGAPKGAYLKCSM